MREREESKQKKWNEGQKGRRKASRREGRRLEKGLVFIHEALL